MTDELAALCSPRDGPAKSLSETQAEQVRRHYEERLSQAIEAAGLGVWIWDVSDDGVWASEHWRRMFGFRPDERLDYAEVLQRIHPLDREAVDQAVKRAIADQSEINTEFRVSNSRGGNRWIAVRGRTRWGPDQGPTKLLGMALDITDRKQAESELAQRVDFERLISELSAAFISQPSEQIDAVIDTSLNHLQDFLGHDQSCLAQFTGGTGQMIVTHSCSAAGIEPCAVGRAIENQRLWDVATAGSGQPQLWMNLPENLPPEAEQEWGLYVLHGIHSTVAIPLRVAGTVLGVIGFSFIRGHCSWTSEFVSRLRLVGDVFANALMRKRCDDALKEAFVEQEQLRKRLAQKNLYLNEQIALKHQHGQIIGNSRALKKTLLEAERVAPTDSSVLLLGETGTGKELLALAIHELSRRQQRPMVTVNCAALPATLIEGELFGREAGAYTGAASAQVGRFAMADGSTLFLDEIGEFPIELQAKLLRVLQDGCFERLGSPDSIQVNVRIIAATNRDLEQEVRQGKFRADLYHRLNVFPIRVPPLRDRREDIPMLVWAMVEGFGRRMGKTISSIPRQTMEQLQQYPWPGNIRELSNVIERAMILTTDDSLLAEVPSRGPASQVSQTTLNETMREQILRVLQETGWRIRGAGGAAELLSIKPTTLEARMAKLGIARPNGRFDIS